MTIRRAHPELRVLGNDLVVVLFRVEGEVVDRDLVVLDVLHDLCDRRHVSSASSRQVGVRLERKVSAPSL